MIRTLSLLACLLMLPAIASAQPYIAGTHYEVLDRPVRTRDASKVEVVEVFWYGCSHCYSFEPIIQQWKKTINADVDFWSSPAMWNGTMKLHAQAFYTAKALAVFDKLHQPLFTTLIVEGKRLSNQAQIADLFVDYGVDRATFDKTFTSFSVVSQVKQADARARSYKVTGTPEVIVNGKYRVSAGKAGGQTGMIKVIDFLIAQERAKLASR
ncbi:MAG: thiol:disulfide interchange protein DsbA [Paraglaciecola psychrophila]|jgi:thiol:disulfide interchange protein DsbA